MIPSTIAEPLPADLDAKRERLLTILRGFPSVAVAFSGGVDSSVVARAAFVALGERAVAITADSPSVARGDLADAERIGKIIGIEHVIVKTAEFENDSYIKNDGSRCYHCKSELYSQIDEYISKNNINIICSGANLDDQGDYRPGLIAAAEHRVRHPLQEAGFTKADVRALAKYWCLPVWDKPASPCLSSRIAPGLAVTTERTGRVEAAENYLHELGLNEARVRYHEGDLARIEVPLAEVARLAVEGVREKLVAAFNALGFRYITLDLAGFRSGSLNDLIPLDVKAAVRRRLEPVTA